MPYRIEIELSDLEARAWHTVVPDGEEWVRTLVRNEVRRAMDSIYESEVARMMADPDIETIPADRLTIIEAAQTVSARDRDAELVERLLSEPPGARP